ncbi:MAG TPA: ATP-dependent DNA helicase RecG, partial [Syntrophomonadaceae bacterium]|nr:ATP-dependent DNA helicase RecG [Syntrophomonadaceae bacterium]
MEDLFQDIQYVKGVGPRRRQLLHRLEIDTVYDFLWYVPRAYVNRYQVMRMADLMPGQNCQLIGQVKHTKKIRTRRRGFTIFKALIQDTSAMVEAIWFNQPYLSQVIKAGQTIWLRGTAKETGTGLQVQVGEFEVLESGRMEDYILPVYPLTEGLSQKFMRDTASLLLDSYLPLYPELLSMQLRKEHGLLDIQSAFRAIHFPHSGDEYLSARRRLVVEELMLFRWMLSSTRDHQEPAFFVQHQAAGGWLSAIKEDLPFTLTGAQQRVLDEILGDMKSEYSMNRLLQGDVGSGKTVVAALAMVYAVDSGFQAAMMAPTEILAEQHYKTITTLLQDTDLKMACLTGNTPAAERRVLLEAVASGEVDILLGTHALIQEEVKFHRLGLVVIDEQHRFGVRQRAMLADKGMVPDILVMTATPIPRTLALTLYGDLDLSVIDELPPGRIPVKTKVVSLHQRLQAYSFARREVERGARVYVICPLVEESEKQDLQAAVSLYSELSQGIYSDLAVGMIHGRMPASEKESVMQAFKKGDLQVLVSTTVVEVGVDVPEANVMIIEHADRFGLSQLHQLRGRVGRGSRQSYCILLADPHT